MSRLAKRSARRQERATDPDTSVVTAAQAGDLAAFERLYDRHAPRINSLAEWMLGSTDTDDVIQDIFLRAWEKLSTFRGEAPFGAWLRKLAVRVLLRYRERQRTREERFVSDDDALRRLPTGCNCTPTLKRPSGGCRRACAKCWCCTTWRGIATVR
jgi:hypothetical protein